MLDTAGNHRIFLFEVSLSVILAGLSAFFVIKTLHWPLVGDASLIHYVVFMLRHGHAPYRDIIGINMPGMYLIDWAEIKIFGGGSLAWRAFDLSLMAIATACMVIIAWRYNRFAGFFAAALFMLVHGRDGIPQTGQRDLIIAVLVLLFTTLLFLAIRNNESWFALFAGFFIGAACTIKPTGILFALALLTLGFVLRKKNAAFGWRLVAMATAGFLIPIAAVLIFLGYERSLAAFWTMMLGLMRFHASLAHRSLGFLLLHSISPLLPLIFPWLYLVIRTRCWRSSEHATLLVAIVWGLFSYCVQGKGYPYHRYPLLAFLLLSMAILFSTACHRKGFDRILGAAALLTGVLVIAPSSAIMASRYDWRNQEFITMLQSDLNQLGGVSLSNHVQCMDTTAGCINTLYRMKLMQSTGFLYDCYFFPPGQNEVTEQLRERFWKELLANPPRIFIVSNQLCWGQTKGYDKLSRWPQLNLYIADNYILFKERTPPDPVRWWSRVQAPLGYRVYLHK